MQEVHNIKVHQKKTINQAFIFPHGCIKTNLFWILLNHSKFELYLYFSDWIGTKRNSIWHQINRKSVITTQIWFDSPRFRIDSSANTHSAYFQTLKQIWVAESMPISVTTSLCKCPFILCPYMASPWNQKRTYAQLL